MTNPFKALAVLALACASTLPATALAQGATVQPVVLDLQTAGQAMSRTVTVQNTSSRPMPVELQVEGIAFDASGPHPTGSDPGDLVVFPAQAMIAPGQTQAFRVQYAGEPGLDRSRHYYVTVAQLPVTLPDQGSAIQLVYDFRVMVNVQPLGARPALRIASATLEQSPQGGRAVVIAVANDAAGYGYLSQGDLLVVQTDAGGREVGRQVLTSPEIRQTIGYGLVGPRETRKVGLPVTVSAQATGVDVRFTPQTRRP